MTYEFGFWCLLSLIFIAALAVRGLRLWRNYSEACERGIQRIKAEDPVETEPTGGTASAKEQADDGVGCNESEIEERTRQLLVDSLEELGCKPVSNNRGGFYFRHQGESYSVGIHRTLIRIWDLPFSEVSKHDTSIPVILEAMNEVNTNIGPTLILSEPNDEGMRQFISRMDVLDFTTVSRPVEYLDALLKMFTDHRHNLKINLGKRVSQSGDSSRENPIDPSMN